MPTHMNHYLTRKREQYAELLASLEAQQNRALEANRDLTEDEFRTFTEGAERARTMHEEVTAMEEIEQRNAAVSALSARVLDDDAGPVGAGGADPSPFAALGGRAAVPRLMPSREQVVELFRAASGAPATLRVTIAQPDTPAHNRAAQNLSDVGAPVFALDQRQREPRRLAGAARLEVQRLSGVAGVAFPVWGEGSAGIAAEGALKPEYDSVSAGLSTPQMIAVWTSYTRQVAETVTTFEAHLRQRHAALIAKREDALLIATVLATAGIQKHTATAGTVPYAESLMAAAALILASDVGAEPNLAVISSADVPRLFGGSTGAAGESPESRLRLEVYGMTAYVSSAIPAGRALVGAWPQAARFVVGMEPTAYVDSISEMKNNIITTLTEEAVALAVDEPGGFVHVSLNGTALPA